MQADAKKAKTPQPAPQIISHEVQTPPGWQSSDKLDPSLYGEHAQTATEPAGHQLEFLLKAEAGWERREARCRLCAAQGTCGARVQDGHPHSTPLAGF